MFSTMSEGVGGGRDSYDKNPQCLKSTMSKSTIQQASGSVLSPFSKTKIYHCFKVPFGLVVSMFVTSYTRRRSSLHVVTTYFPAGEKNALERPLGCTKLQTGSGDFLLRYRRSQIFTSLQSY